MKAKALPMLPHQEKAMNKAADEFDALREHGARDLYAAIHKDLALVEEAAKGRTRRAIPSYVDANRVAP